MSYWCVYQIDTGRLHATDTMEPPDLSPGFAKKDAGVEPDHATHEWNTTSLDFTARPVVPDSADRTELLRVLGLTDLSVDADFKSAVHTLVKALPSNTFS